MDVKLDSQEAFEEKKEETKSEEPKAPTGETYTRQQVEEYLAVVQDNMDKFFRDQTKAKQFLSEHYGYTFDPVTEKKPKDTSDDDDDYEAPESKQLKKYEDRIAMLEKKLEETSGIAAQASQRILTRQLQDEYTAELASIKDDIPELKNPKLFSKMRRDIMSAIDADPRLGEKGNLKKMAKVWWEDQTETTGVISDLRKTSTRGGSSVPGTKGGKRPDELTPEEAKEAILSELFGS